MSRPGSGEPENTSETATADDDGGKTVAMNMERFRLFFISQNIYPTRWLNLTVPTIHIRLRVGPHECAALPCFARLTRHRRGSKMV